MKELHKYLQKEVVRSAERMKEYYDSQHSQQPDFKKGDKVYLIRKNITTKRPSDKLDWKKIGPFKIKRKLGPVTFRLKLPKTIKIHLVFYISLLEPAPGNTRLGPIEIKEESQELKYKVKEIVGK